MKCAHCNATGIHGEFGTMLCEPCYERIVEEKAQAAYLKCDHCVKCSHCYQEVSDIYGRIRDLQARERELVELQAQYDKLRRLYDDLLGEFPIGVVR